MRDIFLDARTAAAEAYKARLASIDARLTLLAWMVAIVLVIVLAIATKLFLQ